MEDLEQNTDGQQTTTSTAEQPANPMLAPLSEAEKAFARGEVNHPSEYKPTAEASTSSSQQSRASGDDEQPGTDSHKTGGSNDAAAAQSLETNETQNLGWITDDAKRAAASYGLGEDDLADFADQADFDRFTRRYDRTLAKAGIPASGGSQANQEQTQQGGAGQAQKQTAGQSQSGQAPQVSLDEKEWEGYDDKTRALVAHTRALNERFQQVEQFVAHSQQVEFTNRFHDTVDQLGDKRLGTSVVNGVAKPLTGDPGKLREQLWEATGQLEAGIRAQAERAGKTPEIPPMNVLIKRAYNMLFGDNLKAEAKADAKKGLLNQAARVRHAEQTRRAPLAMKPLPKDATISDRAKHVADAPEIVAAWNAMQEQNS